MKNLRLFIPLIAFGIFSCEPEEQILSKRELLTKQSWRVQQLAFERFDKSDTLIDVTCIKNNKWTFSKDGTYTIDYGDHPQRCSDWRSGQVETGKWRIEGEYFYILKDFDPSYPLDEDDNKILQLTENTFVLSDTSGVGKYSVEKYTYTKF